MVVEAIVTGRVPVALAVIAAVLGGYIFFVERDQPGTATRNERRKHLLQDYDETRVLAVRFQDGLALTAEGEGFDRRWRYPDKTLANEDEVERYLSVWQHAVPLRTIVLNGESDLVQFGFGADTRVIQFTVPGDEIRVTLGTVQSLDGSFYVRVNDAPTVQTVDEETANALTREAGSFRTRPDGGSDLDDLSEDAGG